MLSLPRSVKQISDKLRAAGHEAWVVGGCVRDSLLGVVPKDWDMCTDALPGEMISLFGEERTVKAGLKHGTVGVITDQGVIEITTYRTESTYQDNRHPDEVFFVRDIRSDLSRRDFTVNAMAYCPEQGLLDLFGGQKDLADGIIRCMGEPAARFREDALRILRALRFAARYRFTLEEKTAEAASDCRRLLLTIAGERCWEELKGIFAADGACRQVAAHPEIFKTLLPEADLSDVSGVSQALSRCMGDTAIRFSLLFSEAEKAAHALKRLHADTAVTRRVTDAIALSSAPLPTGLPQARRTVSRWGRTAAGDACVRLTAMEQNPEGAAAMWTVLMAESCFSVRDLAVSGEDLLALGMKPGREVGQLLQKLLEDVFDNRLPNRREALLQEAERCLQQNP